MASGGKWWQVVANGGRCWEVRRNGVSLCDFVRSLKNSTEFDIMVQHALLPIRGRRIQSLRAFRRTNPEDECVGALVICFLFGIVFTMSKACLLDGFIGTHEGSESL